MHFTGDLYASFVSPLLPVFADVFALSMTQVGLLAGINRFLMFIVQPIAGYFADHYRTRLFILGGPILSLIFIPLVGVAPSFLVLILFRLPRLDRPVPVPPAGGRDDLHLRRPALQLLHVHLQRGRHAGLRGRPDHHHGTGPRPTASAARCCPCSSACRSWRLLFKLVPRPEGEGLAGHGFIGSLREALGGAWKSVAMLWVVMVLRAFVSQAFITFFPILYAREGYSLVVDRRR
ncbi:MAG: hypothetical protein MZU95_00375 [Desulfomicrobium escambiense]|nr:hypothetical protein [Desulfomicrobium escambiense]